MRPYSPAQLIVVISWIAAILECAPVSADEHLDRPASSTSSSSPLFQLLISTQGGRSRDESLQASTRIITATTGSADKPSARDVSESPESSTDSLSTTAGVSRYRSTLIRAVETSTTFALPASSSGGTWTSTVESATESQAKLKDAADDVGLAKRDYNYESTLGNEVRDKDKIVTPSGRKHVGHSEPQKRAGYSTAVRESGEVDEDSLPGNEESHEGRRGPLHAGYVAATQSLSKEQLDSVFEGGPIRVVKKHELSHGPKLKPENASDIERTEEQVTTAMETKFEDYDRKLKLAETAPTMEPGLYTTPVPYTPLADPTSVQISFPELSMSTDKAEEYYTTSAIKVAKKSHSFPSKPSPATSTSSFNSAEVESVFPLDHVATKVSPLYKETAPFVSSTTDNPVTLDPALEMSTTPELPKVEPKTDYGKDSSARPPKLRGPSLQLITDQETEVQQQPKGFPATEGLDSLSSTSELQSSDHGMSDDEHGEGAEKDQDNISGLLLPDDAASKTSMEPKFMGNVSDTKLSETDWTLDEQEKYLDEGEKERIDKQVTRKAEDRSVIIKDKLATTTTLEALGVSTKSILTGETEGSFAPTRPHPALVSPTDRTTRGQGLTTPIPPMAATTVGDVISTTGSTGGGCLRFDTGCSSDADTTLTPSGKDGSTGTPNRDTDQPMLTESNVALCITITLSHTWAEFCSQMESFRHGVAEVLSSELRANVRPQQVVIEDHCEHESSRRGTNAENDTAVVRMHLMDDQDKYSQKLTALAAVILHHNDQGRIDLQMMNVCFYSRQHSTPSLMPGDARVYGPASSSVIASITISAIAGASLFLICILLVVLRQRLLNKHNSTSTVDGLSMASFKSSFRKKTIRNSLRSFLNDAFDGHEDLSSPVPFNNLPLVISNKEALEEEFKRIPMTIPRVDEVPPGAEGKNRYANVIPIPETRVHLSKKLGDETSDYINANYVRGYKGRSRYYIACQAPLPETVKDFWRMIWEQQCKVILMLTPCEENGVQRCAPYFPQNTLDCHKLYGDYQVSLQAKDVRPSFTLSTFKLHDLDKNLCRDVYHCWYTAWPPQGVPEDVSSVVGFLIEARRYVSRNQGPTVVHCSPGTGRTGTVLAVDVCMHELEERRRVDVPRVVFKLRQDRSGCVQTKEQYAFIYEALYDYSARIAMQSSQRPSVVSTA